MGIELGTFSILVQCCPVLANFASASEGMFNLTSVGAPIDFWTSMV